jgi:DNA-binding GntR family transcriptional regulator
MSIDLDGADPLYQQIAAVLISRIKDGTYQPGKRVPSSAELAEEFDVSRRTAVSALDVLRAQGLTRGVVGRGTFVADTPPPADSGEQAGG